MHKRYLANLFDRLAPREGLVLVGTAVLVGAGTGFAAVFFIRLIALIQRLVYSEAQAVFPGIGRLLFVFVPVLGALLVGPLIAYFAMEAKGHGVPEVMQAIIRRGGRIRPRVAIAKIVASALCIGTGGSAGREGPIVQVGSALGSSLGQFIHLSDERIKNLVACGAAAGIAATFNAPIAGVTFATEVLMTEVQVVMFGNVVISAVSASIVSQMFLGAKPAFIVPSYVLHSNWEIFSYSLLGVLSALAGVMFIKILYAFEDVFDRWKFPLALKPAAGALCLGVLGFCYLHVSGASFYSVEEFRLGMPLMENMPHVFGSGFTFIEQVLQGHVSFWILVLLIFLKPLATSFTLGSGNSGGVFAPALFTGAMLGGAFGYIVKALFPEITGEVGAYALVGMAAVFSAAARAPLTSMIIVFEMSNDYHLILPLMAAGVISSSLAQRLHPESIYTLKLVRRGIRFEQGRDLDIMQGVLVEDVMNHAPVTVQKDMNVAELFAAFQETHLQGFPVMANDEDLYGIVTMQDMEKTLNRIEETMSDKAMRLRDLRVWDVATPDPLTVFPDEPVLAAIRKMATRDLARLPVVSRHAPQKMVGLISRSDIMRAYDVGLMRKQRAQHVRERMTLRKVTDVEFVEIKVGPGLTGARKRVSKLRLPPQTNIVSVDRKGVLVIPDGKTVIIPGDVLTILCQSGKGDEVRAVFERFK